jgi:carboxylesterase type B
LLKKICPIQYLATMTKKMILSASRLWLSDETYENVTKNKSLNLIVEKHFARLSNWIASNTKEQQSSEGSTWFPTFDHTQTSSNNSNSGAIHTQHFIYNVEPPNHS